jgi:hypothetical protein
LLFFDFQSDLLIDVVREEQRYKPMKKMMIKETPNEIQTRNKDAEKIEDPRLLQIGRKDTQKGRSATKTSTLMQSSLWQKRRTLTFFVAFSI